MQSSLAAYFSHSWSDHDLPINLMLWRLICRCCHLVIDQPQPSSEEQTPYFISRLESMMRNADVMVCCLPELPPEKKQDRRLGAVGDWRYNSCSPYILFELRLAERLDMPRFVLVDRGSRLQKPTQRLPHVRYVERNFSDLLALCEAGQDDLTLAAEIRDWLQWLTANRQPSPWTIPDRTACLVDPDSDLAQCQTLIDDAVDEGGFERPALLTSLFHTDAELYQTLRSLGLLIVDISNHSLLPLYHAAHSLMVPTIRLNSMAPTESGAIYSDLPLIMQGHPAGYQLDVVSHKKGGDESLFYNRILDRSMATSKASRPIIGEEAGAALLYSRTYPKAGHLVFISHNEKPGDRELVELLVSELKHRGITVWEYALENRAGDDWMRNMKAALTGATLMVALVAPRYEKSEGCLEEWNYALGRIPVLPFLTKGRSESTIANRSVPISHESRFQQFPIAQQAILIAGRVADAIRHPPAIFKL